MPQNADVEFACASWGEAAATCRDLCCDYHQVRPLLRALGLVSDPADQIAFFENQLSLAIEAGAKSILISGASDTGMPAIVEKIVGSSASIHAIDICPTPLSLISKQFGEKISTQVADILTWKPDQRFDVIVTHSFFGQFQPAQRPQLLSSWFKLLNPSGRVITVNRIRPKDEGTSFVENAAFGLADEAVRRFEVLGGHASLNSDQLYDAVLRYSQKKNTNPVHSHDGFVDMFCEAGFEIIEAQKQRSPARAPGIVGPSVSNGGTYMLLTAQRPN